jgi:hypothetical protein
MSAIAIVGLRQAQAAALTIDTTGGQPKPKTRVAELNQADFDPTEYRRFRERLAHRVLDAACLTGGRLRFASSRSHTRNGRSRRSSPGCCASIPREAGKSSPNRPSLHCDPLRCGSIASGLIDSQRDPMRNGGVLF